MRTHSNIHVYMCIYKDIFVSSHRSSKSSTYALGRLIARGRKFNLISTRVCARLIYCERSAFPSLFPALLRLFTIQLLVSAYYFPAYRISNFNSHIRTSSFLPARYEANFGYDFSRLSVFRA
jgi:hypothetical protein